MLRASRIKVGRLVSPVLEAGPAEAREAVVFVHGNPGSSSDWSALLAGTGEFARAVAIDMPGFGRSEEPVGFAYDVHSYAAFLQGAMEVLGIERAHLVLHDFGGPFGLTWGAGHPQAWASVVLINIGILPGYQWHSLAKRWRTPVVGELSQAFVPRFAWRRLMQQGNPRGLPEEFVDKMYDDYDKVTRSTVLKLYRNTPDPGGFADEHGAAIAALKLPALVVWGAADPYLPVDYAERQRDFFDVEELILLSDSGHWPFQDNPAAVADAVLPFLRRHAGVGAAA